jgi:hypothetical protein
MKKQNVNICLTREQRDKGRKLARKLGLRSLSALIEKRLLEECGDGIEAAEHSVQLGRWIEGRIYRLEPVEAGHGAWARSTVRKAILVRAEDERRARQYAAALTSTGGNLVMLSPWLDSLLATCAELTVKPTISTGPVGIVWNQWIWIGSSSVPFGSREGESA